MVNARGKNVAFADFQAILEAFGFALDRINGSHHIYVHKICKQIISVQSVGKDAKPYQIRQFLVLIERHNLKMEG